jgi:hypothetical protein
MRMFKKGQFKLWIEAVGSGTEARLSTACSAFRDQAFMRRHRIFATWGNCGRLLSGGVKSDRIGLGIGKGAQPWSSMLASTYP